MKALLLILLLFVGLTASISGLMLISQPDGSLVQMPLSILASSPFHNFLIPGLVLFVMVGLINLMAAWAQLRRHGARYNWAILGGVMIGGWIVVQMILIQTIFWLQFVYLGAGLLIVLTAWQLKGKWVV